MVVKRNLRHRAMPSGQEEVCCRCRERKASLREFPELVSDAFEELPVTSYEDVPRSRKGSIV